MAFEKVLWITVQDKESYSVKLDVMKVGQLLYPKCPGSDILCATVAIGGQRVHEEPKVEEVVTNIVVNNWAKTTTYATAPSGQYTRDFALEQLMTDQAVIMNQPLEGTSYRVSFTLSGNTVTRAMLFNGKVPGGLWFVSQ